MDLSIIIVNWNVRDLLRKCLQSIFRETKSINFEVFVVDNNSSDGSQEMLKELKSVIATASERRGGKQPQSLKLILNNYNAGFAKANNQALAQAQGEFVLFLNPDTEVLPPPKSSPWIQGEEGGGALDNLVSFMRSRPDAAALTCKLVNPDGSLQRNIKRHPTFWSQVLIMLKLHHLSPWCQTIEHYLAKDFDYSREQEVEQVMGAFFLTKRGLMLEIGGWNQCFWLWWEDTQLCADFAERGWKIVYTPIAQVMHHEGKSFAQWRHFNRQRRFNRGLITYFRKNGKRWHVFILQLLSPLSLGLALLAQVFKIKPRPQSKI